MCVLPPPGFCCCRRRYLFYVRSANPPWVLLLQAVIPLLCAFCHPPWVLLLQVVMLFPYSFWGDEVDTFGRLVESRERRGELFLFYSYEASGGGDCSWGWWRGVRRSSSRSDAATRSCGVPWRCCKVNSTQCPYLRTSASLPLSSSPTAIFCRSKQGSLCP